MSTTESPRSAFISVSVKNDDLTNLVIHMIKNGWDIYCTDGTYKYLIETIELARLKTINNIYQLKKISSATDFNEILGGRVKTLHPVIHGSILKQPNEQQYDNLIDNVQMVIVTLYQNDFDIGGHAIIRSSIKNSEHVLPIVNPNDYAHPAIYMYTGSNIRDRNMVNRSTFIQKAYTHIIQYDINLYNQRYDDKIFRIYGKEYFRNINLKYGCNPHQINAKALSINDNGFPFRVLNGDPGYINIIDALYGINLVKTIVGKLHVFAAASYKHNSPAGVATSNISMSLACRKARDVDPKSSFGDFIALSDRVNENTAKEIKKFISDGIIAPGYTCDALKILKTKKQGKFIILECNGTETETTEVRELFGVALVQDRDMSDVTINHHDVQRIVDLFLANTTLKYTQSNSVCFACDGKVIGIAAGQQSRIDCVKLAKTKAETNLLRSHPRILTLSEYFKSDVKKQTQTNAIIQYIENDFTQASYREWLNLFDVIVDPLTMDEKKEWINKFHPVMASDGFIPFRDSVDVASKINTSIIIQPGGSTRDDEVQRACDDYNIEMIHTGVRLFSH